MVEASKRIIPAPNHAEKDIHISTESRTPCVNVKKYWPFRYLRHPRERHPTDRFLFWVLDVDVHDSAIRRIGSGQSPHLSSPLVPGSSKLSRDEVDLTTTYPLFGNALGLISCNRKSLLLYHIERATESKSKDRFSDYVL